MKKILLSLALLLFTVGTANAQLYSPPNATNFKGVLPTTKGGTGSSNGDASLLTVTPTGSSTSDTLADWLAPSSLLNYTGTGGTIVILGSSVAAGVGSSNYTGDTNNDSHPISSTSWVGIMCASLPEFTCKNQSISGTYTASSIARFESDVVKYKPRYVILATSIWNEPSFSSSPVSVGKTYLQNTKKLAKMIQSIGTIPVIHGPYPKSAANATSYAVIKGIYKELEHDFPIVYDFLGTVDNGDGTWFTGLSGDGTHPNDTGHAALVNTIPISMFYTYPSRVGDSVVKGGKWKMAASDSIASPIGVTTRALSSFTMRAKFTFTANINGKAFLSADSGSGDVLRLRNIADVYDLTDGSTQKVTSTIRGDDLKEHDLVMTFNATQNTTKMYIDGVLINTATPNDKASFTRFAWAGQPALATYSALNAIISDCAIWSTELSGEDISSIAKGAAIPRKSLEVYIPLNHAPNVGYALNAAGTNYVVTTPSAWSEYVDNTFAANGTVATALTSVGPTGSNTTVQEWMQVKNAAGVTRYIPLF